MSVSDVTSGPGSGAGKRGPSVSVPRDPQYSMSLERGLAILGCFSIGRPQWGITQLAEELGMSRPTAHRYAQTLVRRGYLVQGAGSRYQLTLKVSDLGLSTLYSTSLEVHARPFLQDLRQQTGFAVSIVVLDGPEVLVLTRVRGELRGEQLLASGLPPRARRRPVYCTAAGKLLLAGLPGRPRRAHLTALTLAERAPNTITNKRAFVRELERVHEGNLAVAEEELALGVHEVAAPVRCDSREVVAAISVEAHSSMIPGRLADTVGSQLIAAADRLSERLGFRWGQEHADEPVAPVDPRGARVRGAACEGKDRRYSQALEEGAAILRSFTPERHLRGVSEVAGQLDLERSKTQRLMVTLMALGYLEQNESRKYRLAPRAADVGIAAIETHPARRHSRALLEQLRDETGHTASLGVLQGTNVIYLQRLRGHEPGQREIDFGILGLRTGYRLPAHRTAIGKLLLASLPEPAQHALIARLDHRRRGPRLVTETALREELRHIPAAGLALSDRELAPELLSIAAPVRDDTGAVISALAIEAHGATVTPEDLLRDVGPRLTSAAGSLT
jgi:IclR family transcriptional regulator, pca regulon regulatory protein